MLEHMKLAKAKRIGPNPSNEEAHEAILSHNFINTKAISRTSRIINIWKDNLTNRFFHFPPPFLHPPSSILNPLSSFPPILHPQSSILHPPSSILNPRSSILHPQSSILHPPSSILFPFPVFPNRTKGGCILMFFPISSFVLLLPVKILAGEGISPANVARLYFI